MSQERPRTKREATPEPLEALEARLQYRFRNAALLEHALTHSSRAYEMRSQPDATAGEDNESLEFLGDAVLGAVVASWLYRSYPGYREGRLTRMRAALVSRKALAAAAQRLNLGSHVRLGKGEEQSGGRNKAALLADTLEAVLAAVYLDGGVDAVQSVVTGVLIEGSAEMLRTTSVPDAKSALQEWFQSQRIPKPPYQLVSTEGPEHDKRFTVELHLPGPGEGVSRAAHGIGRSKKQAEQECARDALQQLQSGGYAH